MEKQNQKKGIIARLFERSAVNTLKRAGYSFEGKAVISRHPVAEGGEASAARARAQALALELKSMKSKEKPVQKPQTPTEKWLEQRKDMMRVASMENRVARFYLTKQSLGMITGAYVDDDGKWWLELRVSSSSKIDVIGGKQWDETFDSVDSKSVMVYIKRGDNGRLVFDKPNRIDDIKEPRDILLNEGDADMEKITGVVADLQAQNERMSDGTIDLIRKIGMIREASQENYKELAQQVKDMMVKLDKLNKAYAPQSKPKEPEVKDESTE